MISFNPFTNKKTDEQKEAYKYNTQLEQDSSAYAHAMPANLSDEALWRDGKEEREALTKWQQDLEPELQQLVHDLRRETKNKDGRWERLTDLDGEKMKPFCNDKCIWKIITLLRPHLSRNLMMSSYSDEIIQRELRSLYMTFILNLAYYRESYEVDEGDMPYVVRLFKSVVRPTFYRALNDGERKHQRSIYKDIFTHGERIEPQKKKLFGM